MKYKNYTLDREDALNWKLSKTETITAEFDQRNPKTGEIAHAKGETYERDVRIGYYGDVYSGLVGIVKDLAGVDCADIKQLASQQAGIIADLRGLLTAKA